MALATGMAAIHAALVSLVSAGDRIVATTASYGTTRAQLTGVLAPPRRDDRVRRRDRPRGGRACPGRGADARPLRRDDRQPDDRRRRSRGARRARPSPRRDLRRRQHVRLAVSVPADRARRRPRGRVGDEVHRPATATSSPASCPAGATSSTAIRSVQVDTGATLAPISAFLALRGLSTLAIRMDRHSATAAALAAWLERQAGVTRVYHPALASHPQHDVAARQLAAGGGMLAFELARWPRRGPGVHRRPDAPGADGLARQRLHDGRPSALDDAPPARRCGARPERDHRRACSASRSGSRISTISSPTSSWA